MFMVQAKSTGAKVSTLLGGLRKLGLEVSWMKETLFPSSIVIIILSLPSSLSLSFSPSTPSAPLSSLPSQSSLPMRLWVTVETD